MPKFLDNIEFYTEGYSEKILTIKEETKDVVLDEAWNPETISLKIPSEKIRYPVEAPTKKRITDISRDIQEKKDEAIYKIGALSEAGLKATNELVQKGLNELNGNTQTGLNSLESKTQEGLTNINKAGTDWTETLGIDAFVNFRDSHNNIENGTGTGSLAQKRLKSDGVTWTTAKAYQGAGAAFGGNTQAGRTEEEFNAYFWDSVNNVPLHGGQGKNSLGEILDNVGLTYTKSYSFAFAANEENKAISRSSAAFGRGNRTFNPGEFVCGNYSEIGNRSPETVFLVGGGTTPAKRHNAFEVRTDHSTGVDISTAYIGGRMVATQDYVNDNSVTKQGNDYVVYINEAGGKSAVMPYRFNKQSIIDAEYQLMFQPMVNGRLYTRYPTDEYHAANKLYVDDGWNKFNIENGTGTGSLAQKRLKSDGVTWTTAKAYQGAGAAFGGNTQAGRTEEEFNAYFWDSVNNVPLHGGQGKNSLGEILDNVGLTYTKSYSFAFAANEENKAISRSSAAFGRGNRTFNPGEFVCGNYSEIGNRSPETVFLVGGGATADKRHNAFEVRTSHSGEANYSKAYIGGKEVATQDYVNYNSVTKQGNSYVVYINEAGGKSTVMPYRFNKQSILDAEYKLMFQPMLDGRLYARYPTDEYHVANKGYVDGKVNELSAAANLENGTGAGSLVQKTVSSSGTPYANEASGSGAVAMGKKVKSKGNATFVTGQENEAIAGTSASFTSGRLNINRGSYNITGGENNANNNSWNLVIGKGNAVSDGRFGIVSGLDNVFTGLGSDENTAVSMLGKNLYVQYQLPSDGALLIGRYNRVQNNTGRLFIVGNGTSPDDRKNAFEVLEDGRAKIQTTPSEIDDVVNKGYVDGSGMQGTGDPPLQGYNKNKGTIEKRLTDLGFKPLQADITTKSINVSGATYNGSIGTMLLQVGRVTYRQGNMASLSLNIAFASQSLGTSESNQFYEFYFNSAEATVSDIIPKNYRPTSNYIFTVYSRINMELRSGSDTLVTKIQDAIPIKCTVKTSGDITLQIYAPLTASNGSGVINYSKTRREIVGTNRGFNIGYPVNPYV